VRCCGARLLGREHGAGADDHSFHLRCPLDRGGRGGRPEGDLDGRDAAREERGAEIRDDRRVVERDDTPVAEVTAVVGDESAATGRVVTSGAKWRPRPFARRTRRPARRVGSWRQARRRAPASRRDQMTTKPVGAAPAGPGVGEEASSVS
jgi:hypothetical protein